MFHSILVHTKFHLKVTIRSRSSGVVVIVFWFHETGVSSVFESAVKVSEKLLWGTSSVLVCLDHCIACWDLLNQECSSNLDPTDLAALFAYHGGTTKWVVPPRMLISWVWHLSQMAIPKPVSCMTLPDSTRSQSGISILRVSLLMPVSLAEEEQ